jgi:hypothetical protein
MSSPQTAGASLLVNPDTGPEAMLYKGRPDWLTDGLFSRLLTESWECRQGARLIDRQFHRKCGPVAAQFARSAEMLALVGRYGGTAAPSAEAANYLYYEREGDGIDPHIDADEFTLNVLLLLVHEGDTRRSSLVLFPAGPKRPVRVDLNPAELVLFRAGSVVHGRTGLAAGERVHLIGMGYRPGGDDQSR